jgi:hypothetical protein
MCTPEKASETIRSYWAKEQGIRLLQYN